MIKTDMEKVSKSISAFMTYQRRAGFGVFQMDITRETGISQHQLSEYEHGTAVPSLKAIIALADMFDVSIDYLLGRCGNSQSHKMMRMTKYRDMED